VARAVCATSRCGFKLPRRFNCVTLLTSCVELRTHNCSRLLMLWCLRLLRVAWRSDVSLSVCV
jgi:hypothetical protein